MKRTKKILTMLLVFTLVFTLIPINVDAASKVKINKTKATMYIGKTETLKISGTSKTVNWSSSDKKIATVNSKGKVTPKKEGNVTITAKVSGKKYTCKVTVKKPYINTSKKTVYVGSTYTLKLTGTDIKSVKTSNSKVATISKKGKVTAKKAGTAKITLTGKDKKTYKCTITVKKPYINKSKKTLEIGETYTLKLTGTSIKSVSSSNSKVATVSKKGKVSAKKAGTATITLKGKDGKSYKCTITVNKAKETHEHKYTSEVTKKATCAAKGVKTYTCSCGDSYTEDIPKTSTHSWNDGEVTTEPSCMDGVKTYTCTVCEKTKTEAIKKTGEHSWDSGKVMRQGSEGCKITKTVQYSCTSCGTTKNEEVEEQSEHIWDNGKVTTEATCKSDGVKTYTCSYCKTTKTENFSDKDAHHYEWTVTKQPSSTTAASEADFGSRTSKCSVCGTDGITEVMVNIGDQVVCGVFDNDAADELFEHVNKERDNAVYGIVDERGNAIGTAQVPRVERDTNLDFIAKLRAAQCAIRCDHWDENGNPMYLTDNENLATGQGTAVDTFLEWFYSTEHRNTMIEPTYETGGCANFWYDANGSGKNLYPTWVLTVETSLY